MHREIITPIVLLMLATLACNLPDSGLPPSPSTTASPNSTPTAPQDAVSSPTSEAPTPTLPELTGEAMGGFQVAILVDLSSEPVARAAAEAVPQEASTLLQYQTGFVFDVIAFRQMERTGTINQMASTYLNTLAPQTPNGLVIFSYGDDDRARLYGGYSGWVVGPEGYRNTFVSPVAGDQHVYLAVMHWSERYGECGYGGSDEVVSQTSIGGECRNQPSTACVQRSGYSMCANVVDDLYASTPTYFLAASIVHEFIHPFGTGTNDDHYGTPQCQQAMGWTEATWTFSVKDAERFNVQCPNLYAAFDRGYRP